MAIGIWPSPIAIRGATIQEKAAILPIGALAEQLAEIAGYCFIIVDGMYTPKDLEGLYDMLIKSLRKSRTSKLILPGNDTIQ